MAAIRSKDTLPELTLRKAMHALGLRYRMNDCRLPGKPDLVFPRHQAVVFVHGCFWHRHANCKVASTPKSNTAFWLDKFARNVARDEKSATMLCTTGWRVFIVWECELGSRQKVANAAARLYTQIMSGSPCRVGMSEALAIGKPDSR